LYDATTGDIARACIDCVKEDPGESLLPLATDAEADSADTAIETKVVYECERRCGILNFKLLLSGARTDTAEEWSAENLVTHRLGREARWCVHAWGLGCQRGCSRRQQTVHESGWMGG
jgi:hypothetical protein